jgi:pimeloyl-ACP methyl ester carboxylesterase
MKTFSVKRIPIFRLAGLFLILVGSLGAQTPEGPALVSTSEREPQVVGSWLGVLEIQGLELRLGLTANAADGKLTAVIDSIDQNAKIPVTRIETRGAKVRLEARSIAGGFQGAISADGAELSGTWSQGGSSWPLVFKRQEKPFVAKRPQEPAKPYPYREADVVFPGGAQGIQLAGTLNLPEGKGPFPAVVLMSGSGPQDRDEAVMGHKPFLVLADHLTRAGIAVLRYDDRGVARSGGKFAEATHLDFAADGRAAFEYLKTRSEIDPSRIGLLGHSEGSVHAPLAAIEAKDVAFIVSLAGVGVPMQQLLERQAIDLAAAAGVTYAPSERERSIDNAVYERLRTHPDDPETPDYLRAKVKEAFAAMSPELKKIFNLEENTYEARVRLILTPWFKKLALYDPVPVWGKIRCPVLAINGDKDSQVAADENLSGIKCAVEAGGNRDVTIRKFPGLNHLFQHCQTGAPREYAQIEETMSPEVLALMAEWILARAGASAN